MWKLSAALLLMPVLIVAGTSSDHSRAHLGVTEVRVGDAVQQAQNDWKKADFSVVPSAEAAVRPAVSVQTVAMVASY